MCYDLLRFCLCSSDLCRLIAINGVPVNSVPPKVISNHPTSPSWNLLCLPMSDTHNQTPKSSKRVVIYSHPSFTGSTGWLLTSMRDSVPKLCLPPSNSPVSNSTTWCYGATNNSTLLDNQPNSEISTTVVEIDSDMIYDDGQQWQQEGNGGQRRRSWERVRSVAMWYVKVCWSCSGECGLPCLIVVTSKTTVVTSNVPVRGLFLA